MITPTAILYRSKILASGRHPVMIQIVIDGRPYRKSLFAIDPIHWDDRTRRIKASSQLHVEYNTLLVTTLTDVERRILACLCDGLPVTSDVLEPAQDTILLSAAIRQYTDTMKTSGKRTWNRLNPIINHIVSQRLDIPVKKVTSEHLQKIHASLITKLHHNTASKRISLIKTVLRQYDIHLIYKAGFKATTKDKLSRDELFKFFDLPLVGLIAVVRDAFALAFWMRGSRIGDVLTLQKSEIVHDRIVRSARKTGKEIDMAVVAPARIIIDRYASTSSRYVLPLMTMDPEDDERYFKHIESKTTVVNRYLKIIAGMAGIDKTLTSHLARHTFGYLADQHGMTSKRIQDLLDHSNLRITELYISDLKKKDTLDTAFSEFVSKLIGGV